MVVDRRRTVVRYPPAKLITPLDNPDPIQGWVERSDTHQLHLEEVMGFAGLNLLTAPCPGHEWNLLSPPCGDLPVGRFCVESALQKYFGFHPPQIISTTLRIPPHKRGVS